MQESHHTMVLGNLTLTLLYSLFIVRFFVFFFLNTCSSVARALPVSLSFALASNPLVFFLAKRQKSPSRTRPSYSLETSGD